MSATWLSLVPPLFVLFFSCLTESVLIALCIGIFIAALIANNWAVIPSIFTIKTTFFARAFDPDSLYMFCFLFIIGILITLINKTGGAHAFACAMTKKIKNAAAVQKALFFLSLPLSLDDYLSTLTIGHVMRPLMDHFAIPRVKLAFLIHCLAGPVVLIMPLSSFMAYITTQLDQIGVAAKGNLIVMEPFSLFLQTIPFIFYSLITLISVYFIVHANISYGPMHTYEQNMGTQKEHSTNTSILLSQKTKGTIADLFFPLINLIGATFFGILYSGGYFHETTTLLNAFQQADNASVLLCAALYSLGVTIIFSSARKIITRSTILTTIPEGIMLMLPAIIMVLLASILGSLLQKELLTGQYLAQVTTHIISLNFFPTILFVISFIVAFSTGSSWATIALMFPIALPMLLQFLDLHHYVSLKQAPQLLPTLGAICSGAMAGDHTSPLSETTIMAAASSGTTPIEHTKTQFPYATAPLIGSIVAYTLAGFTIKYGIVKSFLAALVAGSITSLTLLSFFNKKN